MACVIVFVMFDRTLRSVIREEAGQYPVIAITGPRQSGKTTLAGELFPEHKYVLLEDPDIREQTLLDARGFFRRFSGSLIPTEIKSSETFHKSFCKNLKYLNSIQDRADGSSGECIYGGEETFDLNNWTIRSWRDI